MYLRLEIHKLTHFIIYRKKYSLNCINQIIWQKKLKHIFSRNIKSSRKWEREHMASYGRQSIRVLRILSHSRKYSMPSKIKLMHSAHSEKSWSYKILLAIPISYDFLTSPEQIMIKIYTSHSISWRQTSIPSFALTYSKKYTKNMSYTKYLRHSNISTPLKLYTETWNLATCSLTLIAL